MVKWLGCGGLAFVLFFGLFFVSSFVSLFSNGETTNSGVTGLVAEEGTANVSEEVERYRPLFEEYAKKHGVEEYVDLLLAKTMQESGGRYADVMQSSESLGLPRNTIQSPERSIDVGIEYFSEVLEKANGDVKLTLQAYNYGNGFIDYAEKHNNGEYSKDLAVQFSQEKEAELGWSNYGDTEYVDHVMRYVDGFEAGEKKIESTPGEWSTPISNANITSEYGMRMHPIDNVEKLHAGTDFACSTGDELYAVKDAVVERSLHSNTGLGNHIILKHGESEYSTYGHMNQLDVEEGQDISQGEAIGTCGSTGGSTGPHLHLEYRTDPDSQGSKNPREVLGL